MAKQPNIILISCDELRYDCIQGPNKPDFLRTPHLDRLAARGISFERNYSDCPVCVPARCTIMSGQHGFTHGMMWNGATADVLDPRTTLPGRLHAQGYQTLGVGKMHFEPHRVLHGFDDCLIYADYEHEMNRAGRGGHYMKHGLGGCEFEPTMATVPEALTYTSWTADKSMEFIRDRRDPTRPFFLWTSFAKPHAPLDPPEPYYSMYRGPEIPIPEAVIGDWASEDRWPLSFARNTQVQHYDRFKPALIREIRAAYYGLVTQIDYNLGRILAALADTGEVDNTWIIFTSDHGEYLGDHRSMSKCFFHEASGHVPLLVVPPSGTHTDRLGTHSDQLVCLADLLPTLVGMAGGRADDVDGQDILAVEQGDAEGREYLETELGGGPWYTGITDGDWKYLWYHEGGCEQLFHTAEDPDDRFDLSDRPEHADQKARLKAELIRRKTERGSEQVRNGEWVVTPPQSEGDTERDRRAKMYPGIKTERYPHDFHH